MAHLENIRNYWNMRAEGYSASNRTELESEAVQTWMETIMRYAPEGESLSVLDIGCGPGFFSIIMAQNGHRVTSVDYSDEMLKQAMKNAEDYGVVIKCQRMDAQNLEFEDESFDLIITRNVMWCLEQPERAYKEWLRVLRKGGKIINCDGNHYLDRFDHNYEEAVKEYRKESNKEHKRYIGNVDTEIINRIALDLPLSIQKRPEWDFCTLTSLGAHKITAELFQHLEVKKESGSEFYANSFVISALK